MLEHSEEHSIPRLGSVGPRSRRRSFHSWRVFPVRFTDTRYTCAPLHPRARLPSRASLVSPPPRPPRFPRVSSPPPRASPATWASEARTSVPRPPSRSSPYPGPYPGLYPDPYPGVASPPSVAARGARIVQRSRRRAGSPRRVKRASLRVENHSPRRARTWSPSPPPPLIDSRRRTHRAREVRGRETIHRDDVREQDVAADGPPSPPPPLIDSRRRTRRAREDAGTTRALDGQAVE